MSARAQRWAAIAAALLAVTIFITANVRFLTHALRSEPACVASPGAQPARPAC